MINKIILFVFILLIPLSHTLAMQDDPEVFQTLRDNNRIACAEIDKEYAICWELSGKFSKLQINQLERDKLQSNYGGYCHNNDLLCDLSDSSIYVSTLRKLVVQIIDHNDYYSDYTKNCISKVRALGAAIYIDHGHSGMVEVCDNLPMLESLWDGIGDWLG